MEQDKKSFKSMSDEKKRAYNRESAKRYRERVKDTDEYKQRNLACVNSCPICPEGDHTSILIT